MARLTSVGASMLKATDADSMPFASAWTVTSPSSWAVSVFPLKLATLPSEETHVARSERSSVDPSEKAPVRVSETDPPTTRV